MKEKYDDTEQQKLFANIKEIIAWWRQEFGNWDGSEEVWERKMLSTHHQIVKKIRNRGRYIYVADKNFYLLWE